MKPQQDASASARANLFSRFYPQVGTGLELPRRFVGPFRFLPASPSFIPGAHSGIHSRGVLLAATRKISASASSAGRARARYRALPAERQSPEFMTVALNVRPRRIHLGVYPRRRVRDSFTKAGAKFLCAPPSGRNRSLCARVCICVRESPLTRVELRRYCSRDNAISRFLGTVISSASSLRRVQNGKHFWRAADVAAGLLYRRISRVCGVSRRSPRCP